MNYCSGTIDIILNKSYVSMLSFSRVFNPLVFYRGSAWIVLGSAGALPGSTLALQASFGNDRGHTGMNRSFTWALSGWSGAHPGWLVGNYRSAALVSVTATIISPQIVPDHPNNLPGWSNFSINCRRFCCLSAQPN
jgi:hypothetical protein